MATLLPVEIKNSIPPLYSQAGAVDPIAYVKLQGSNSVYAWFITEFNHEDNDTCFGYLFEYDEGEFGYFSLDALQMTSGKSNSSKPMLTVTRDMSFESKFLSVAIAEYLQTLNSNI